MLEVGFNAALVAVKPSSNKLCSALSTLWKYSPLPHPPEEGRQIFVLKESVQLRGSSHFQADWKWGEQKALAMILQLSSLGRNGK